MQVKLLWLIFFNAENKRGVEQLFSYLMLMQFLKTKLLEDNEQIFYEQAITIIIFTPFGTDVL
jgi:hypothetical protein